MKFVFGPKGEPHYIEGELISYSTTSVRDQDGRVLYTRHEILFHVEEPSDQPVVVGEEPMPFGLPESLRNVPVVVEDANPRAEILLGSTAWFLRVGDDQPQFAGDMPTLPDGFGLPLKEYMHRNPGGGDLYLILERAQARLVDHYYGFRKGVKDGISLVLTPTQAQDFARSPEFHDLMKYDHWALSDFVRDCSDYNPHPNTKHGLPSKLYGIAVVIQDTSS